MTTRRFEYVGGSSRKFWEIAVAGKVVTVRFGRIGADGQTAARTLASPAAAEADAAAQIAGKLKKGYAEVGAAAPPAKPAKLARPKELGQIGAGHWTSGPMVVAPAALHARWSKQIDGATARWLNARRKGKPAKLDRLGADPVLLLPRNDDTRCVGLAGGAVALVSVDAPVYIDSEKTTALRAIDLGRALAEGKPSRVGTLAVTGPAVLCDTWAKHPEDPDRKKKVALPLGKGEHEVSVVSGWTQEVALYPRKKLDASYQVVVIAPPGWSAPAVAAPAPVEEDGALVASPAVIAAGKKLAFCDCDGTGFLVVPREHAAAWRGVEDDDDYDRACAVNGVGTVKVGGGAGLVVGEPGGLALHPIDGGALLILWSGAESGAGCLAAALAVPEKSWKKTKARFDAGSGDLVLMDFGEPGAKPEKGMMVRAKLAPGSYAVDTCWSFGADVRIGKKVEETSVAVIRLRRQS